MFTSVSGVPKDSVQAATGAMRWFGLRIDESRVSCLYNDAGSMTDGRIDGKIRRIAMGNGVFGVNDRGPPEVPLFCACVCGPPWGSSNVGPGAVRLYRNLGASRGPFDPVYDAECRQCFQWASRCAKLDGVTLCREHAFDGVVVRHDRTGRVWYQRVGISVPKQASLAHRGVCYCHEVGSRFHSTHRKSPYLVRRQSLRGCIPLRVSVGCWRIAPPLRHHHGTHGYECVAWV